MGDDPFLPVSPVSGNGSSSANNYFINNFGKPSLTILVVVVGLALGIAIGSIVTGIVQRSNQDQRTEDMKAAFEARVQTLIEQMRITERELRMHQHYTTRLDALLVENQIIKAGDDFQKFKASQPKE